MLKKACLAVCLVLPLVGCLSLAGDWRPRADRVTVSTTCYWLPKAEVPKRIAVLDFEGQPAGKAITDVMVMTLLENGFTVLERDHLQDVLNEMQIAEEGYADLSDVQKAQKLGKILNADAILTGKLLRIDPPHAQKAKGGENRLAFLNGNIELAARAVNVKTGEIIWMSTINVIVESKTGKVVRYMDYVEEASDELVYSLKHPDYKEKKNAIYKGASDIERLRKSRQS
jgi:curli biogenesis system outer membrane secretion channel CsgG